jgi:hypothetical protein
MIKTTILVVCAFCAGVGTTAVWSKWEPRAQQAQASAAAMPSIQELHAKAGVLPDLTVREPF